MLFSKPRSRPEIARGGIYRRLCPNNVVETARVHSVWSDEFGIPHVEFDLRAERKGAKREGRPPKEKRTLSLYSFSETYSEEVRP